MRAGLREGLAWMLAHPGRELALVPQRWLALFRHGHPGLEWAVPSGARRGQATEPGRRAHAARRQTGPPARAPLRPRLLRAAGARRGSACPARWRAAAPARSRCPSRSPTCSFLHGVLLYGEPRYHAPLLPVLACWPRAASSSLRRACGPCSPRRCSRRCALACGDAPRAQGADACARRWRRSRGLRRARSARGPPRALANPARRSARSGSSCRWTPPRPCPVVRPRARLRHRRSGDSTAA